MECKKNNRKYTVYFDIITLFSFIIILTGTEKEM